MPFDGNGNFTPASPAYPAVSGQVILASRRNALDLDFAQGLTNTLTRDGQSPPTANIPLAGFRLLNVGAAELLNDATNADDVQSGRLHYITDVAGSDTITGNLVEFSTYAAGNCFRFVAAADNETDEVTLNINGLGAKAITKFGATALEPGDILEGAVVNLVYDGTRFQAVSVPDKIITLPEYGWGQCRLVKSGSNLLLSRFNGNRLTINDETCIIPTDGVTLAATGLTPSTLYYIYAYINDDGDMTLESSGTGHAVDPRNGMRIKAGDATRALVGMARPITGPAWQDAANQRFVRSWFNRDKPRTSAAFTADRSTSSSALGELNAEIRNEMLVWLDENIQANFTSWGDNASSASNIIKITMDGVVTELGRTGSGLTTSTPYCMAGSGNGSEGYHYITIAASTSAGTFRIFGTGAAAGFLNCTIG